MLNIFRILVRRPATFLQFLIAGFIVAASMSFVVIFWGRVNITYSQEEKVALGGDASISNYVFSADELEKISAVGLVSSTTNVSSMVLTSAGATLVSLLAVSNEWPLYGGLDVYGESLDEESVYIPASFASSSNLYIGDSIKIGAASFFVKGIINSYPDVTNNIGGLNSTLIILQSGLTRSGIDLSRSRSSSRTQIAKKDGISEKEFKEIVLSYKTNNNVSFPSDGRGGVRQLDTFGSIAVVMIVFLVLISVLLITYCLALYKKRNGKFFALIGLYGAKNSEIDSAVTFVVLCYFSCGSALGIFFVYSVFEIILNSVDLSLLAFKGWQFTWVLYLFAGILLVALPAFLYTRLPKNVAEQLLKRGGSSRASTSMGRVASAFTLLAILICTSFVIWPKNETLYGLLGLAVVFGLMYLFYFACIVILFRVRKYIGFSFQFIVSLYYFHRSSSVFALTVLTFCLALPVFAFTLGKTLESTTLGSKSLSSFPAAYIIGLSLNDVDEIHKVYVGVTSYPVVRGRMINVGNFFASTTDDGDLKRDFNLTYRSTLIEGERLLKGEFEGGAAGNISMLDDFARRTGAKIGDEVNLEISGFPVNAVITSIHSSDRQSGRPFFYMIFSSGTLEVFPKSYFAVIPSGVDMKNLKFNIANKLPSASVLDTKEIIDRLVTVAKIARSLVYSLSAPLVFLSFALLIFLVVERFRDALMHTTMLAILGLSKRKAMVMFGATMSVMFVLSSLIAVALVTISVWYLLVYMLGLDVKIEMMYSAYILTFVSVILFGMGAYFVSRKYGKNLANVLRIVVS